MEYKIVYSARKTLAVKISNGRVTVLAPKIAQNNKKYNKKIADFVIEKQSWIEKTVKKQCESMTELLPGIMKLEKFYKNGRELRVEISDKSARITLKNDEMIIPRMMLSDANSFKIALKKSYKRVAAIELKSRLDELSRAIGLPYSAFRLSDAETRWGSCTSQKHIMLNWRLVLLKNVVRDYVILHELCHTVHLNHSTAFWQTVEHFCPNYRNNKSELKLYGFLTDYLR